MYLYNILYIFRCLFLFPAPHCSGVVRSEAAEVGVCMCQGGSTCEGAGSRAKCSTGSMSNIFSNLEAPVADGNCRMGHGMSWDNVLRARRKMRLKLKQTLAGSAFAGL